MGLRTLIAIAQITLFTYISIGSAPSVYATAKKFSHIEYGCANYDGVHNDVLRNNMLILAKEHDGQVVIFLNDYNETGLKKTAADIKKFLNQQGVTLARNPGDSGVELRILAGDFTKIQIPKTDSAALTNPDGKVIRDMSSSLEKFAKKSKSGLKITTYFEKANHEIAVDRLGFENSVLIDTKKYAEPYITREGDRFTRAEWGTQNNPNRNLLKPKIFFLYPEDACTLRFLTSQK